jgi:hypothetical protein
MRRVATAADASLRQLVRGEDEPLKVVQQLGGSLSGQPGLLRVDLPADVPVVELPRSDLAHGLLRHWSRGTSLQEWATVVLAVDVIQFVERESPSEDRLLEALWSASAGEPIADDALALADSVAQ